MTLGQFCLLIVLAALWGASFLFMRVATPEFGPFALIAIRVGLASLVLMAIWYWRENAKSRSAVITHWRQILIVGLFNSAIPFVLFAWSTLHITGGMASILNSTATIWAAIIAWAWLAKKPGLQVTIGLVLGMTGVLILVQDSLTGESSVSRGWGVLAATFAAFLYGIAANYTGEKLTQVSSLTVATFSLVAAALVLLPLAFWFAPNTSVSHRAWAAVIAMGVLSTAVPNIIYFHLLATIGATRTITVTLLIPLFGTMWGALFINERITFGMMIGGSVILLSIALVTNVLKFGTKSPSAQGQQS